MHSPLTQVHGHKGSSKVYSTDVFTVSHPTTALLEIRLCVLFLISAFRMFVLFRHCNTTFLNFYSQRCISPNCEAFKDERLRLFAFQPAKPDRFVEHCARIRKFYLAFFLVYRRRKGLKKHWALRKAGRTRPGKGLDSPVFFTCVLTFFAGAAFLWFR